MGDSHGYDGTAPYRQTAIPHSEFDRDGEGLRPYTIFRYTVFALDVYILCIDILVLL